MIRRLRPVKLLVDMNLSPRWPGWLAEHGVEAVHWSGIGAIDAPDWEIMEYAVQNGYVVFTQDLDFGALLAISQNLGPSVVQLRNEDVTLESMGDALLDALQRLRNELEQGAFLTIDAKRARLRLLPLRQPE